MRIRIDKNLTNSLGLASCGLRQNSACVLGKTTLLLVVTHYDRELHEPKRTASIKSRCIRMYSLPFRRWFVGLVPLLLYIFSSTVSATSNQSSLNIVDSLNRLRTLTSELGATLREVETFTDNLHNIFDDTILIAGKSMLIFYAVTKFFRCLNKGICKAASYLKRVFLCHLIKKNQYHRLRPENFNFLRPSLLTFIFFRVAL